VHWPLARVTVLIVAIAAGSSIRRTEAQQDAIVSLKSDPAVSAALAAVQRSEPATLADQERICEVPAPPFEETARGELLRREFVAAGLRNVRVDRAGNVLGDRPGLAPRPRLVVAAHLDTVFPAGTDVRVSRDGLLMRGPGIADNCRGLAVLVRIIRALDEAGVKTPGSITFVANVGEEGLGDLRGVKALFGETMKDQIDRFISIDGGGLNVTHVAVGSQRYRVTFKGPGGHSFGGFGLASPIGALGRAVARISELRVPDQPRTTFNVGRIGGGTSVNAIPFEAWMEVDMRSADPKGLAALVKRFHEAVDSAVADENTRWGRPGVVTVSKVLVGHRPTGTVPADAAIVRTARAVASALGLEVVLSEGSTDANLPISMKIPAITIGAGGRGVDSHALTEYFDTTESWRGTQNAVLLTVALARP
jgi:acetylornithine deacetylase/succinyl-diaminopimelate desuccinylase-like protein